MTAAVAIRKVTKAWTTKDGERIRICDMTDDHLLNTIALCQRAHRAEQATVPFPSFGGDMAQFCAERDYDSFQHSEPDVSFPLYDDLCTEALRRGLELPEDGRRKP